VLYNLFKKIYLCCKWPTIFNKHLDDKNRIHFFVSMLFALHNDMDMLDTQKILAGDSSDMKLPQVTKPE